MVSHDRTNWKRVATVFAILAMATVTLGIRDHQNRRSIAKATHWLTQIGGELAYDCFGQVTSVSWEPQSAESTFTNADLNLAVRFPYLQELNVVHSSITDAGLLHLKHASDLRVLRLECRYVRNKPARISDAGVRHLANLKTLTVLKLESADLTDRGLIHLAKLTNLIDLDLFGTEVSDDGLIHLRRLKNLKYLNVGETQWEKQQGAVTSVGIQNLQRYLPNCYITN